MTIALAILVLSQHTYNIIKVRLDCACVCWCLCVRVRVLLIPQCDADTLGWCSLLCIGQHISHPEHTHV